eukprot:TRINITY_DN90541_c0_g1_i1.p1 TRINITY_DN90541_c0_g1~~TRINITY_DN90541_c0_g1_i1.p1  ORF type:complete len:487 (-),score=111.77 TRINITY_DN90541_c0_g1_i1:55-1515(-)
MPTAIKISGRSGRNQLINDTYEPMTIQHHNRPCWVARAVNPRYLFHSGKSRWVISKQIDDGARCWAYVQAPDSSQDPSSCPGPWICCDQDDEWRGDPAVQCVAVPADHDKFVQLRMTLDADMRQYHLVDPKAVKELWKRLDYNGNNVVSLAEIDKLVVDLVAGGTWPSWLNSKPALMRAYKKTILKDGDGDDWVEKQEFHALLLNIFWFGKLWQIFAMVDSGHDRRIDFSEFHAGLGKLGLSLSESEAQKEFQSIDGNHGGQVLFVEFCAWVRNRVNPDAHANFDGDIVSGEHCGRSLRKHKGHHATQNHTVSKKNFKDFDDLERKIKVILSDHHKCRELWRRLDYNGNNIVSLAEIDKMVVEEYPLLNHKPALMRAYKKAISKAGGGDGDAWVERKEFKKLMAYIFYFNKLFWVFEHEDGDADRRLTAAEFKKCMVICGCSMSDADFQREFRQVDKNGGGIILFDEFCQFFASKNCPQAMTALVD